MLWMLNSRERRRFTPEEYLLLEERAETKSEYCDGEIFAMTGGTLRHAQIVRNLLIELQRALKGTSCQALGSDLRLYVQKARVFTYPDVLVVCGAPPFMPGRSDTLRDARLIVEVLSPSTESYDRGEKFLTYQGLDSLQEYVLVAQETPRLESWHRQGPGHWAPDARPFASLGIQVLPEALYEGLFDPE